MPRTNQDGRDIKMVLCWLTRRHLTDSELARALEMPTSNYSRRKDADDYPMFEELNRLCDHFQVSKRALQIAFGFVDESYLLGLNEDEISQYVDQGGGEVPFFPIGENKGGRTTVDHQAIAPRLSRKRRERRADAPPGP